MARKPIVPQRIENDYSLKLRKVAKFVGFIVENHTHIETDEKGAIVNVLLRAGLNAALSAYSTTLTQWAEHIAGQMLTQVNNSNKKWLVTQSNLMSKQIKSDIHDTAIGAVMRKRQGDQVTLIKSLPLEAGERAQKLAQQSTHEGWRASDLANELKRSGEVTKSRANLIARTEVHKSWAALTQARAQYVGANQYVWKTAGDEIVRESHADMEGVVCDFDSPPTLSDGDTGNAGEFPNCRCYAEPIIKGE